MHKVANATKSQQSDSGSDTEDAESRKRRAFESPLSKIEPRQWIAVAALAVLLTLFTAAVPLTQPRVSPLPRKWLKRLASLNASLVHVRVAVPALISELSDATEVHLTTTTTAAAAAAAAASAAGSGSERQQQQQAGSSFRDFQIRLENEIADVVQKRDTALADFTRPPTAPPQILQQQQQQRYYGQGQGAYGAYQMPFAQQALRRQDGCLLAQEVENEAPQEAISERPGGPYVSPPDFGTRGMKLPERARYQREFVRKAFQHSWRGYKKHAWGYDELQPRSCSGKNWNEENPGVSLALTVMDGLTTMHVMGLETELHEAMEQVRKVSFAQPMTMSTFECTIRIVGALLSLYELRGEKKEDAFLLDKARDVADRLMFAFNTTSGLPHQQVNLVTHQHNSPDWAGGASVLSEFGTVQLELRTLSLHTGDPSYDMRATHIMDIIESRAPRDGMCPCFMSIIGANWLTDHITVGALGDSFYEYVLKQYLLTGKREARYDQLFRKMADAVVDNLIFRSAINDFAYVAEFRRNEFYHKMDHLACFFGGTLALAANKLLRKDETQLRRKWMNAAADLTHTCYEMYHQQKSGVSPEYVEFMSSGADFINGQGYYILRPETFESLFYMWRFTKDQKYRDWGWNMFRAIDRWCKVESGGYAGIKEVNVRAPIKDNLQQSFWLAETLKYAYLLFCDDGVIDLDKWVFNTEAHPLKIRDRDPLDVWRAYERKNGGRAAWTPPAVPGMTVLTETDLMKRRRVVDGVVRHSGKDFFSQELDAAAVDDEGLPFDPNRGMRGIPHVDRRHRERWWGPLPATVLYQGAPVQQPHRNQQQQQPQQQQQQQQQQPHTDLPHQPAVPDPMSVQYNNAFQAQAHQAHDLTKREFEQQLRHQQRNARGDGEDQTTTPPPSKKSSFASKYRGSFSLKSKKK